MPKDKNKKKRRIRVFAGLNPFRWMGYQQVKEGSQTVRQIGRATFDSFKGDENAPKDFEGCMKYYNLTEEDLDALKHKARMVSWFCFGLMIAILLYCLYLLKAGTYTGVFISFVLSLLAGSYAFRESFNLYRMKQRSLNCTIGAWFKDLFKK